MPGFIAVPAFLASAGFAASPGRAVVLGLIAVRGPWRPWRGFGFAIAPVRHRTATAARLAT